VRAKGKSAWLRYASYHILYALRLLSERRKLELKLENLAKIQRLTAKATRVVYGARKSQKKIEERKDREYSDVLFFKSKAAKQNVDKILKSA
jgi:hypothetical protein